MRFALSVLLVSVSAVSASAQVRTDIPTVPIEAAKETVRTLASDDFEGRAPGTPGEQKTLDYLVRHFEKLGLKPGFLIGSGGAGVADEGACGGGRRECGGHWSSPRVTR